MFDRAALARVVPFAIYMAFIVVADLLARAGMDAQSLRWLYPVKIAAVILALCLFRRRYTELAWRPPGAATLALALATGLVVLVLWVNLDASWMTVGDAGGFDPRTDGRIDWRLAVLRLIGGALVVPVMEELFWRSFLLRWLTAADFLAVDPARFHARSFVISVILFGVEHNLWLAGIVAGAIYTVLYMRTRNLWMPIFAHAVTNGLLGAWILVGERWSFW
ncbi:CAAX prenyl protease-related protein [Rugamonas sp. FT107W]|uniref:CAAX prenyl protease-related protein n=1 Tax=Duganella vulcania TaxID=2692166 RepID=A0A845HMB9_9BURK|nr:CAAX prenyl protease-related protein [Duganella vulcania]MYN17686.1 CAAX prenyl protease-related protein [Duganella vulcania]